MACGFVWVPFSFMGGDSQRVQLGLGSAKPLTMASGWVGVGSPPRACWPHPHHSTPGLVTPDLSALARPTRLQPHHPRPVGASPTSPP